MSKIVLDGDLMDHKTADLKYIIPAPYGPNKGPAFVHITAKPASKQTDGYMAATEEAMNDARLAARISQREYDETKDDKKVLADNDRNAIAVNEATLCLQYEICIVSWETNIQLDGKDMKPTKANWLILADQPDPFVQFFQQLNKDLFDYSHWRETAAAEIEKEEAKNLPRC